MFRASALLLLGIGMQAKEQHLVLEESEFERYELTYDDNTISTAVMKQVALLSPRLPDVPRNQTPFRQIRQGGADADVDKWIVADEIEDCAVPGCDPRDVPDAVFLANAEANLAYAREEMRRLNALHVPAELEGVRTFLRETLTFTTNIQLAKYAYLKRGDTGAMRKLLCEQCSCGGHELLLDSLTAETDPATRLQLARHDFHNAVLDCGREHLRYPIADWQQFLSNYHVREQTTYQWPD